MPKPELVDITCTIKIEREKAVLLHDGSKDEWVPRSLIEINDDGTVTMPVWKAKEKGFI